MTALLLSFVLATAFPSATKTSWMTPQSFRLMIGMPRAEAVQALESSGWAVKQGRNDDEVVIDYSDGKAMTLEFRRNRLKSVRFELFALLPQVREAFDEHRQLLQKELGAPKRATTKSVVVYDDRLPNIMVVLHDDPKSEYGQKGLGYLAVRYFDPLATPAQRQGQ